MTINPDSKTAELSLSVTGGEALEEDVTYAIPLTVNEAGSDIQFNNEESRHCMYFVNDMRKKGDVFKGEDKPKGFLFIEVNDVNPLNALSFQLENGKYLWDAWYCLQQISIMTQLPVVLTLSAILMCSTCWTTMKR